jgi:hypothetical protein
MEASRTTVNAPVASAFPTRKNTFGAASQQLSRTIASWRLVTRPTFAPHDHRSNGCTIENCHLIQSHRPECHRPLTLGDEVDHVTIRRSEYAHSQEQSNK